MKTTTTTIPDQAARTHAIDPRQSFIVQAPAGSGKTELLAQRYLNLLAHVSEAPEQILAITFTRKAATEMRDRIISYLQLAATQPMPSAAHARKTWELARAAWQRCENENWQILNNPHRLRIQTIDGFCSSLTRQMPILSQLGSNVAISDYPDQLYRGAAQQTLKSLEGDHPWSNALAGLLLHLDNNYAKVENLFVDMLGRRDQWLPYLIDYHDPSHLRLNLRNLLEENLKNVVIESLENVRSNLPEPLVVELLLLARFAGNTLLANQTTSLITHCAHLQKIPTTTIEDQKIWLGIAQLLLTKDYKWRATIRQSEGFPAPSSCKDKSEKQHFEAMKLQMISLLKQCTEHELFRQALQEICEAPPLQYSDEQWQIVLCLLQVLPVLVAQLRVEFQAHGVVDYIEVASSALTALGEPEAPTDLALTLDYRLQHLLIDEFQDTSIGQYRLLTQLTTGWQAGDGRTLFLVGDPMQSIYRFRKADVGLFLQVREKGIGQIKLQPLTLIANFRSTAGIIDWINHSFAQIFPQQNNIQVGAVAYSHSHAMHETLSTPAVQVHPFFNRDDDSEARTVVTLIKNALQEDSQQSIAILVRSKAHLQVILPALQLAGIRYRAIEIDALTQRSVIQDLLALTRALLHLGDRIAWLALLRAPWCGLQLADLHSIASIDHHACIWDLLNQYQNLDLTDEGKQRLLRIMPILTNAIAQRQRLPLQQWIEGTWLSLGGPATLQHTQALNDAKTFFNLLANLSTDGDIPDHEELIQHVEKLFASADANSDITVEVMTIHKAKGLEFDRVILPGLGRKPRHNDPQLLLGLERPQADGNVQLLMAPIKSSASINDQIYSFLTKIEARKSEHESARLLYVATTRAKKALHLLGHCIISIVDEEPVIRPPASGSLLGQLWNVVADDFAIAHAKNTPANNTTPLTLPQQNRFLKRLKATWQPLINLPSITDTPAFSLPTSFNTEGLLATHQQVGIMIHQLLHQITEDGLQYWHEGQVTKKQRFIIHAFRQMGIIESAINACTDTVIKAIAQTLADTRGRWLLDNTHQQSQAEYPITAMIDDKILPMIIDRTFVDDQGVRWIIDYKTATPGERNLDEFFVDQHALYSQQLANYAKAFKLIESRPIKFGLYFPLIKGWYQWDEVISDHSITTVI